MNEAKGKRAAVLMSGGIDSSAALYLLIKSGYEVSGITGEMCGDSCTANARPVAEKFGIKHYSVDLREYFSERVIQYFDNSYRNGLTPNPCIVCNRVIKWGKLFDIAINEMHNDYIATGHYADIKEQNGLFLLYPAKNRAKDQLYFLYNLPKEVLSKTLFPLASFESKDEIRKIAYENDLPSKSAKESQDICFIRKPMSSAKYIQGLASGRKGKFIMHTTGETLGIHEGAERYTPGQRKGIGIAYEKPLYVIKTDIKTNTVYLGEREDTYYSKIEISEINIHDTRVGEKFSAAVKIRYNTEAKPANIDICGDFGTVTFDSPVSGAAPGQAAVFFDCDDGHLIGGGTVNRVA